jgi:NADPH-dependent glutamate synthase beta subunit-like oxidoreductase/NAD(P)H-flavin reductase
MSPGSPQELVLGIPGFTWADLFRPDALARLHAMFLAELSARAPEVAARFDAYRTSRGAGMTAPAVSDVLVDVAPHVGAFVAGLFGVEAERRTLLDAEARVAPIFRMKDELVKRRALKRGAVAADPQLDETTRALLAAGGVADAGDELEVARFVDRLLDLEAELSKKEPAPGAAAWLRAAVAKLATPATGVDDADDRKLVARVFDLLERWLLSRRPELAHWRSFNLPRNVNFEDLVELRRPSKATPELVEGPEGHRRHRDGFRLTDRRWSRLEVSDTVDYCLYCHNRDKDSCSKGMRDKDGRLKPNPLGITLTGCPLGEKISEMHVLRKQGDAIASLALVTVDNPMCAGTGHRICNDCMKACIFQKQDPVNIPQAETGVLTDVLALPWGFEIYGFLTRWNPLNVERPYALPYHGKNVLVVGLGPAGYTLAHHLANEGFGVVGIDGLKIEPLPERWLTRPIRDLAELTHELDERPLWGFGGVSEYGITVRWDKNFLTMMYVMLARREHIRFHGGVRFGGTLKLEDAWELGFHHVAIAAGAGRPTVIDIENNLIRGIRAASDFLMSLQLTGAFKRSTLANLQVRLPAVVIGGGLTAIDTATELRAYYVIQAEKILERHEGLVAAIGEPRVRASLDPEEQGILDELLAHGRAIRAERAAAAAAGRAPSFDALIDAWGGVTIAYRRKLADSPAYRLNHEEVHEAMKEGVRILENATPKAALPDEHGALRALAFSLPDGRGVELAARTLCVAAGTAPNTIYEKEHPGTFALDKKGYFLPHRAVPNGGGKPRLEPGDGFFTSYLDRAGHTVTYYGDNHPRYAGSVVKAMASAKDGHPAVVALFAAEIQAALADAAAQPAREAEWRSLVERLEDELRAVVLEVNRLTPTIVEVIVRAPRQARTFHPGQFYRLHNFETESSVVDGTRLLMEGIALTGAWVDKQRGLLSLVVLEMGGSSRLCAALRPGEQVVVMGPTGTPTEIPRDQTVLLAGGGLGNAVLFSIARAMRDNRNKVIYFAGYRSPGDLFKQEDIEAATDQVIWSSDQGPPIRTRRPQDRAFVGNIVQSMIAYATGELGEPVAALSEVDRIIAIGSDRMMAAVARARHTTLSPYLKKQHVGIGSINSPMQCMMKEVCAQCLQKHVDPITGQLKEVVFSCFNQDQNLDEVDWKNLNDRLRQNTVQEKLSDLWLDHLMRRRRDAVKV